MADNAFLMNSLVGCIFDCAMQHLLACRIQGCDPEAGRQRCGQGAGRCQHYAAAGAHASCRSASCAFRGVGPRGFTEHIFTEHKLVTQGSVKSYSAHDMCASPARDYKYEAPILHDVVLTGLVRINPCRVGDTSNSCQPLLSAQQALACGSTALAVDQRHTDKCGAGCCVSSNAAR